MKFTWLLFFIPILAALSWLGVRAYKVSNSPFKPPTQQVLPGADPEVSLGRQALEILADQTDPVQSTELKLNGSELQPTAVMQRMNLGGISLFLPPEVDKGGELDIAVKTTHRNYNTKLTITPQRKALTLYHFDLELPAQFEPGSVPDTALAFSPDNRVLAIGSGSGELKCLPLLDTSKNASDALEPWEKRIAEGVAKTMAFSADSELLYVGEQSPDAFVYAFSLKDGKEVWKFRLADELESTRPQPGDSLSLYMLPTAQRLIALPDGDVLVLGMHSWMPAPGQKKALSRIYRLDGKTGKPKWKFPADAPAPRVIPWFDAVCYSPQKITRLACVLNIPGGGSGPSADADLQLVFLKGENGEESGRLEFAPFKPLYSSTFFWQALALSADGSGGLLGVSDGRCWAFTTDDAGKPALRWTSELGTPIQAGSVWVQAPIGWAASGPGMFFVELDKNFEQFGASAPLNRPPDVHPEASSVQAFDAKADKLQRLWRFPLKGRPQGLWVSPDQRWLACASNLPAKANSNGVTSPPEYTALMLDLSRTGAPADKLCWLYSAEGPLNFAGVFSPDGRMLAITEGPRPAADKLPATQTYRVLVLH